MPYLHISFPKVVLQKSLSCESGLATGVSFLVSGSPGFGLDGSVLE